MLIVCLYEDGNDQVKEKIWYNRGRREVLDGIQGSSVGQVSQPQNCCVLSQTILHCGGSFVYCRMPSAIADLYSLDAGSTLSSTVEL